VDQSQFVIAQSQVTDLVTALGAKANLAGGNSLTGTQTVSTGADANKGLIVKANSGTQSGNLFEAQNSSGAASTILTSGYSFLTLGNGAFGTTVGLARITAVIGTPTNIGVIVKGAASQTANLQEWQNSAGGLVGSVTAGGGMSLTGRVSFGADASARFNVSPQVATQVGAVVRGAASQTANLQEWQNSAGSVLASVTASGNLLAQAITTPSNNARISEVNSGGILQLKKATASAVPGAADFARLFIVAGTTTGTLKLVVRAGAAGAETTILDNIPQ
jgi:hypothetical protein